MLTPCYLSAACWLPPKPTWSLLQPGWVLCSVDGISPTNCSSLPSPVTPCLGFRGSTHWNCRSVVDCSVALTKHHAMQFCRRQGADSCHQRRRSNSRGYQVSPGAKDDGPTWITASFRFSSSWDTVAFISSEERFLSAVFRSKHRQNRNGAGFLKCHQCGIVGNRSEDLRCPLASSPQISWEHRMCWPPSMVMNPRVRNFRLPCFSALFNTIRRAFSSAYAIEPGSFLLPFNVDSSVEELGSRARHRPAGVAALCRWFGYVWSSDNPF